MDFLEFSRERRERPESSEANRQTGEIVVEARPKKSSPFRGILKEVAILTTKGT